MFSRFLLVRYVFILCLSLYLIQIVHNNKAVAVDLPAQVSVLNSVNTFSFKLYKILSELNPKHGVFVSPLSLQIVLVLLYIGARGKTANEMVHALHLPTSQNNTLRGYNSLFNIMKDPELQVLIKIFVENRFDIKEDFRKNAIKYFESKIEKVNFKSAHSSAVRDINKWVEQKTNGQIKELVTTDVVNGNTVMILINVIHFKAGWQKTFPASLNTREDFYITKNKKKSVDMMHLTEEKFRYLEHDGLKSRIIEIPYKDHQFSMYIILPYKMDGLPELEEKIGKINIYNELKKLRSEVIDVTIPKFTLTQTIDFKDILQNMGMKAMFSEFEADFSGITNGPLTVSNVMQNTHIEVNENGTEASAGTGTIIGLRSYVAKPHFTADHPFLFIITKSDGYWKDRPLTLFIGKFN